MSQPNVVPRVNSMVQSMERPFVDLTGSQLIAGKLSSSNDNKILQQQQQQQQQIKHECAEDVSVNPRGNVINVNIPLRSDSDGKLFMSRT